MPKLAGLHPDKMALTLASSAPEQMAPIFLRLLGAAAVVFGLAFLLYARRRWPWLLTIALMAVALIVALAAAPQLAAGPFSPLLLNLIIVVIAMVGLLSLRALPSASRCLRRAPMRDGKENGS